LNGFHEPAGGARLLGLLAPSGSISVVKIKIGMVLRRGQRANRRTIVSPSMTGMLTSLMTRSKREVCAPATRRPHPWPA